MVYISLVTTDPTAGSSSIPIEITIARVKAGDKDAFDEIVRRYEGLVLRLARRMTGNREDALDVAQDSFLRIYRSLARFRTGRRFESWVYRIVINASWDHLKRRGGLALVTLDEEAGAGSEARDPAAGADPEAEVGRLQLREKLDALLEELSPRLRAVFVLRDIEGLETGEISRILGCREVTVRRHSMEARDRVRTLLRLRFPGLAPGREGVRD